MATIGVSLPTLLDVQKRIDPNGSPAMIVEMLSQTNDILLDAGWQEGNLPTGHQTTQRTGLPAVYYRRINQGVPSSKSTTAQITEACAMLEALSKIDVRLVELNGTSWMMSEEAAYAEAMNQQLAETVFYGSTSLTPEEFTGLAVRYSSLTAVSGENILDAGGTSTDNTSIYHVTWGPQATFMFYPKGAAGGLTHEDLGKQIALDNQTPAQEFSAYRSHWKMTPGLAVADWRANVRIANIDVSNLVGETSAADILKLMTKAVHKTPRHLQGGKRAFYCNRTVFTMLDIQAQNKSNVYMNVGEEEGRPKLSFRGIPIRLCDQILDTEARVT